MFRFSTQVLAYFCRLWFQWRFTFQSLCGAVLVRLVNVVLMGPSLVPAGVAWGSRRCFTRLRCLMSLGGGSESLVCGNNKSSLALLWWNPPPLASAVSWYLFWGEGILKTMGIKASWARLLVVVGFPLDGALVAQYLLVGQGSLWPGGKGRHFPWLLIVSGAPC